MIPLHESGQAPQRLKGNPLTGFTNSSRFFRFFSVLSSCHALADRNLFCLVIMLFSYINCPEPFAMLFPFMGVVSQLDGAFTYT